MFELLRYAWRCGFRADWSVAEWEIVSKSAIPLTVRGTDDLYGSADYEEAMAFAEVVVRRHAQNMGISGEATIRVRKPSLWARLHVVVSTLYAVAVKEA